MYQIPLSPYNIQFYTGWKYNPERIDDVILSDQYLEGNLDVERFNNAFKRFIGDYLLCNSHIEENSGKLFWVKNNKIFGIDHFKKPLTNSEIFSYIKKSFNLEKGPLYRIALINYDFRKYRLIMIMHHIIINGITAPFLLKELSNYYNNENYNGRLSLNEQQIKINELFTKLSKNVLLNKRSDEFFWKEQLSNIQTVNLGFLKKNYKMSNLSSTLSHSHNFSLEEVTRVGEVRFSFGNDVLIKLNKLKKQYVVTPYLYGQNIYAILINLFTGQDKFCINYSISIPESFDFIYGAQINTTLIPYDFSKIQDVVDVIQYAKNFHYLVKQGETKHSNMPIDDVLLLKNENLLTLAFDQAFVRIASIEFENIKSTLNYEINIDLWGKLWFGQELYKNEIVYSVLYNLDHINILSLNIFINSYKLLFVYVLDKLVELDDQKTLKLSELEDILFSNEEIKNSIILARNNTLETKSTNNQSFVTRNIIEDEEIEQMISLLKNINKTMPITKKLILLLGDDAEKSALISYIKNNEEKFKTKIINKELYCDFPMFHVNDSIQNILNAFVISQLGSKVKSKIKILLVISLSYLENKGILFIKTISHLSRLFNNFSEIKNGLSLVITSNFEKINLDHIKEEIKNILEDQELSLSLKQVDILEFFASKSESNIVLLSDKISNNLDGLFSISSHDKFINKNSLTTLISEKSKVYIIDLFNKFHARLQKDFDNFIDNIKSYYLTLLNDSNFELIDLLIQKSRYLLDLLDNKSSSKETNNISQAVQKKLTDIFSEIELSLTIINFCKEVAQKECHNGSIIIICKESTKFIIDFMLGNTLSKCVEIARKDIDIFAINFDTNVNMRKIYYIKQNLSILGKVRNKLNLCNNFDEIQPILRDLTPISSAIVKLAYGFKTLQIIDNKNNNISLLDYFKSTINKICDITNNRFVVLKLKISIDIENLFREFCTDIIEYYSKIYHFRDKKYFSELFQELIVFLEQDEEVTLINLINSTDRRLFKKFPKVEVTIINDKIISLRKLITNTTNHSEIDVKKYLKLLSLVCMIIKNNDINLSNIQTTL